MSATDVLIIATILIVIFFALTIGSTTDTKHQQLTLKQIRDKCIQDVIISNIATEIIPDDIDNFMRDNPGRMVFIYDSKYNGILIYSTIEHDTIMYHLMVAHNNIFQTDPKVFSSNFAYINHSLNLFRDNVFATTSDQNIEVVFANSLPCEFN